MKAITQAAEPTAEDVEEAITKGINSKQINIDKMEKDDFTKYEELIKKIEKIDSDKRKSNTNKFYERYEKVKSSSSRVAAGSVVVAAVLASLLL